jgi:hypothetical protein
MFVEVVMGDGSAPQDVKELPPLAAHVPLPPLRPYDDPLSMTLEGRRFDAYMKPKDQAAALQVEAKKPHPQHVALLMDIRPQGIGKEMGTSTLPLVEQAISAIQRCVLQPARAGCCVSEAAPRDADRRGATALVPASGRQWCEHVCAVAVAVVVS